MTRTEIVVSLVAVLALLAVFVVASLLARNPFELALGVFAGTVVVSAAVVLVVRKVG